MGIDFLLVAREEREHRWVERKNSFNVRIFHDREEPPDPAGLCDGGDYVCQFQLRMEKDGSVYLSWEDRERNGLSHITFSTYRDFYEKVTPLLKTLRGVKRCGGVD